MAPLSSAPRPFLGDFLESLPEDVLLQILSHLPRRDITRAQLTCTRWRRLIGSPGFQKSREDRGVGEPWLYILRSNDSDINIPGHGSELMELSDCQEEVISGTSVPVQVSVRSKTLPKVVSRSNAVHVTAGSLLFSIGGMESVGDSLVRSSRVDILDLKTHRQVAGEPMGIARANFACGVIGSKIVVIGGTENDDGNPNSGTLDGKSGEFYNLETCKWLPIARCHVARTNCRGVVWNGRLVVGSSDVMDRSLEIYDPAEDTWQLLNGVVPSNQLDGALAVACGSLFLIGGIRLLGWFSRGRTEIVSMFDENKKAFVNVDCMPRCRPQRGQGQVYTVYSCAASGMYIEHLEPGARKDFVCASGVDCFVVVGGDLMVERNTVLVYKPNEQPRRRWQQFLMLHPSFFEACILTYG